MFKKTGKMYHYTYIIWHTNGRYYVGRRSCKCDPYTDLYMGSGKWVKSIKDKSTLTKYIIAFYDSMNELQIAEMELIEKYFDDEYCMNVAYSSCGTASGDKNYNYGKTGELSHNFGLTHTDETKQLISASKSGDKNPMYGRTGNVHPKFGKKLSEKTKQLMSDNKPRLCGDKNHMYGKHHTEEAKQKMSDANLGDKNYMRGKLGKLCPNFGKTHSDKTKQLMSAANSGEKAYQATITDAIAKLIKIRLSEGLKVKIISIEFNTTVNVVNHIRSGKSWKHVTI